MSSGTDFIREIKEQIDYTHKLENAYLKKHDEVEFLYYKLQEMVYFLKVDNTQFPRINDLIHRIEQIITRQTDEEEEQLEVLQNSKDILEDVETKISNKLPIKNLIKNLDSKIKKKSRRVSMDGGGKRSRKNYQK